MFRPFRFEAWFPSMCFVKNDCGWVLNTSQESCSLPHSIRETMEDMTLPLYGEWQNAINTSCMTLCRHALAYNARNSIGFWDFNPAEIALKIFYLLLCWNFGKGHQGKSEGHLRVRICRHDHCFHYTQESNHFEVASFLLRYDYLLFSSSYSGAFCAEICCVSNMWTHFLFPLTVSLVCNGVCGRAVQKRCILF